MTNIIFLSIKLAPRLLFQAYVQPSKAYDFLNQDKKNQIIFVLASFWGGLLWGAALSIPHYFLYRSLIHSIIFAFAAAFALAMAAAAAAAVAGSVPGAVFFVFVAAFVSGGLLAAAGGGAASGAVTAVAAGAGGISIPGMFGIIVLLAAIFGIYLFSPSIVVVIFILIALAWFLGLLFSREKTDLKNPNRWYILFLFLLMIAAAGRGLLMINTYETVIYPISFVIGYLFSSAFKFTRENKKFQENLAADNVEKENVARQNYSKRQKASLIWGPLIALLVYLPVYFNWAAKLQNKLPVVALGFALMPIFILRIPDYLLCLPVWLYQRRKILKKEKDSREMLDAYQKSVLFKHEMLVLPLPGTFTPG